jgi:hypothetical protein
MTRPCGTLTVVEPCEVTVTAVEPCVAAPVVSPCLTPAASGFGLNITASRIGATLRDRTIPVVGEVFFSYILADADQFIVTDTGEYLIAG